MENMHIQYAWFIGVIDASSFSFLPPLMESCPIKDQVYDSIAYVHGPI